MSQNALLILSIMRMTLQKNVYTFVLTILLLRLIAIIRQEFVSQFVTRALFTLLTIRLEVVCSNVQGGTLLIPTVDSVSPDVQ